MCQGVIGIVNTKNNQWNWGVGSHSGLIKEVYGENNNTVYDRLVRFECDLVSGPGPFTIEGGDADADLQAIIKDKIEAKIGSPQLLVDYIKEHGWDDAFLNTLSPEARSTYEKAVLSLDDAVLTKAATDAAATLDKTRDKVFKETAKQLSKLFENDYNKAISKVLPKVQKLTGKFKFTHEQDLQDLINNLQDLHDGTDWPDDYEYEEDDTRHNDLIDAHPEMKKAQKACEKAEAARKKDEIETFCQIFLADPANRNDKWKEPEKRLATNAKRRATRAKAKKAK